MVLSALRCDVRVLLVEPWFLNSLPGAFWRAMGLDGLLVMCLEYHLELLMAGVQSHQVSQATIAVGIGLAPAELSCAAQYHFTLEQTPDATVRIFMMLWMHNMRGFIFDK